MDSPWLHVYTAHKLSLLQQRTFRLTSELTASKWLSVRHLLMEASLVDGDREKEARLRIYTPAVTYIRVRRGGGARLYIHKALRSLLQLCLKGRHVGRTSPVLFQAAGWGVAEKQNVKASASLVTLWTPALRGNISLENSKLSHTLHVASAYGKHNLSLSAALNHVDKVSGDRPSVGPTCRYDALLICSAINMLRVCQRGKCC